MKSSVPHWNRKNFDVTDFQWIFFCEFVDVLKTKTNVEFVFQDERLSSVSAEELLLEGGMKRKDRKQNIDKVAAAIILESYLNSKK